MSHIVAFRRLFANVRLFTMRRGIVSLTHVVCWSPGLVATIADAVGQTPNGPYEIWCLLLIVAVSISFIFDLRDVDPQLATLANLNRPEDYLAALAALNLTAPPEVIEKLRSGRISND